MSMRDFSEKRDFHRMQVNSEIDVTTKDGRSFKGVCRDLSGTGMQLYVDQPMAVGDELFTVLPSASEAFPPFETSLKVLRAAPDGNGFLLGTAILEVKH